MTSATVPRLAVDAISERIAPLQGELAAHPLYAAIRTPEHLRIFMKSHVFAVWEFMCLLKSLQRTLTSVDLPWTPSAFPASRRFINEIVLGEESDVYEGRPLSHFEIYLEAMKSAGADTGGIDRTLQVFRQGRAGDLTLLDPALASAPAAARRFVQTTFRFIGQGSVAAQAAAFTFGREDAIPAMFRSLVRDLNREMDGDLGQFVWYLERHIEVDGDEHGPLSLQMVADLCGDDEPLWAEAADAAEEAIRARIGLWDGILAQMRRRRRGLFLRAFPLGGLNWKEACTTSLPSTVSSLCQTPQDLWRSFAAISGKLTCSARRSLRPKASTAQCPVARRRLIAF